MKQSQIHNNLLATLFKLPFQILFSRFTLAFLALLVQVVFLVLCVIFFDKYLIWIFGGSAILGLLITVYLLNTPSLDPAFNISWIILILVFPTVGVYVYLFVKLQIGVQALGKRYQFIRQDELKYMKQDKKVLSNITKVNASVSNYVAYMNHVGGYPLYQNSHVSYYPFGEDLFPHLLEDLRKAKDYIFLEYFIIAKGFMWNSILDILKEKVKEGVEVYLLYDGTCSFVLLPSDYPKELKQFGIHVKIFNPVIPIISTQYNNRDHRKIAVIDGEIAYTGGINLADEYINKIERFGIWKDNGIRIKGEAVRSFVILFLENWNAQGKQLLVYERFIKSMKTRSNSSFVLPFGDNPFDQDLTGEMSYLHVLQTSKKYVHIITPYLVLDHAMLKQLCNTALRNVDVKIIMPGIKDKPFIYYLGRTYYKELLEHGVKIYEYTPGFTHAKMFVSDDEKAVIGTINLDFRSLYLHFENGVFLYQDDTILKMEEDFSETLRQCEEVTLENLNRYPLWKTLIGKVLRVFAPLL